MAAYQLPTSFLTVSYLQSPFSSVLSLRNSVTIGVISNLCFHEAGPALRNSRGIESVRAVVNGDYGAPDALKTTRRGRKKGTSTSASTTAPTRKRSLSKKQEIDNGAAGVKDVKDVKEETKKEAAILTEEEEEDAYDDGMDSYDYPPLICCFGAAQKEFVPTVRVSEQRMHPDIYSQWKMLQWKPPEFVRAPGGSPSNVAISHVRLGGRAAFMGKVGKDNFGDELVYTMNKEKVQTRAVKFDPKVKTAASYMKLKLENGKMKAETVRDCAEDSFRRSEVDLAVLKEARIFHFNSEVLTTSSMKSALFRAIRASKKFGGLIFFDLNLPLQLWRSRDETREVIKQAWNQANIIEVSREELEFLLDEDYYERRRNYKPQYYAESFEQTKDRRDYYHYTKEEIAPLWHDGMKLLFVTDGTLRIHYYAPSFDGVVIGTEDVLITPFTCDRTGSGDAVVAGILRKLTTYPQMFEDQDVLQRQIRFAIAAGIISQWTIGAVRGFPTESATQNLKEQVYVPSLW
ncbi:fructokinase-like 1, chloroplastic [Macadamia integrifolia]|uniref:fructokinase-like 1, chloroplastic n=1 Tax=Macadamia integrifolia TaxID=60698 RepID=UPI001C5009CF|nr:fructokinase-like 1, chloroplastic [Macadamia integrifolia]XP_042511516.1 fructokinase-like 1, chloroplastic [Macadamia integrifolia]XP_042511517.1 fructokinase-like 1, chloroplastic [Macadamia integrifolia]XP_042511518.1 fructokinase-like 1, chloroplastic [Macadamia integrifolia]XP_042511519.1 fructokinase-like 1, chloroplastic [Macadamia integrifolia]XP_042511520.1 fructokinase-like 1, chloroplastic [Macadamia integrifolia]XP_042511521.1 fructokinase-like 1, chloroplastic [Macadamia inte